MGEIRERPEIQVIGHSVLCESQIAAGTTGHPQDTAQSFNCPPKVEKSIRPSMCLRYWGLITLGHASRLSMSNGTA